MKMIRFAAVSLLAALWMLLPLSVAAQEAAKPADELASVPRVSVAELKDLLATGNVLVLDVRDAESYKTGHIPGSLSLPLADVAEHAAQLKAENRPIITYCA